MKKIYQIIFGIMAAIWVAACADDKELATELLQTNGGTMITVDATMPGGKSVSKVGLAQESGSFNVTTQWQYDDEIQLFAYQDGKSYSIGKVYVSNITSDNKSCSFSFQLPEGINSQKTYNVFGLCGIEGSLDNGVITINAPMKRVPLSLLKAPCYFATQATSTNITANFKYIGTYEILHIANYTGNTISFAHNGYTAESTWFNSGMRNTLQCSNASGAMSYFGTTTPPTVQDVDIASGETASIVSWYYPNGNTITNATLNATINGSNVQSSNTKSSNIAVQNGKAYHLYAIWNGKALKFSDRNMEEETDDINLGLVAYYPFDTDADDHSGNGNNGIANNLTLKNGISGKAYNFAGVDDAGWIRVPNSPTLQFEEAASFAMWVNVNSYRGMDGYGRAAEYGNLKLFSKSCDHGDILADLSGIDQNKWQVGFWGICYGRDGAGQEVDGNILQQWHHFAFVATKNYLKIYFDGNLICTKECESDFTSSNGNDLWIGKLDCWGYYFNGKMDEFRIYNRALNDSEVSTLYNMFDANNTEEDEEDTYSYVDLGLPSGTLWATCNVGAQNPWDYGDYFAWGEVTTKDYYSSDTYKYANGDSYKLTKYCSKSDYGNNGFTDNLTVLEADDDAATVNWGSGWRMPTQAEFQELYDNCDWEWASDYNGTGVAGRIVKSRNNSNSLFLPAAGWRQGTDLDYAGSDGYYWSSSLYTATYGGRRLDFYSGRVNLDFWCYRNYGLSVRPVWCRN